MYINVTSLPYRFRNIFLIISLMKEQGQIQDDLTKQRGYEYQCVNQGSIITTRIQGNDRHVRYHRGYSVPIRLPPSYHQDLLNLSKHRSNSREVLGALATIGRYFR